MPVTSYFGTLAFTLLGVLACGVVGGAVVSWLPWRQRPAAGVFLAPLVGAAVFALLATAVGWSGHGFRTFPSRLVTMLVLVLAGWQQRRDFPALARRAAAWALFGAIASLPLLHQFWIAGSCNLFNDAFMYIVHAEWLQTHGFTEPSGASWEHPAWAQVAGFQGPHLRMGASFLLGWMQATTGLEWSCDVYPAVVMLGLIGGALSIGATVLWVSPRRWIGAWLAALGAAVTLNGFAFGAVHGFLSQTFGIGFGTAALSLWGAALADCRSLRPRFRHLMPGALCAAASIHCYSEFSPFLVTGLLLAILIPWPSDAVARRRRWRLTWPAATALLVLVNLEWFRLAKSLPESAGIVAGKPFAWMWLRFPAHAIGLAAGESRAPWPGVALTPSAWGYWAFAVLLTGGFIWLMHRTRPTPVRLPVLRHLPLAPLWILLALAAIAFACFRYVASNPWQFDPAIGSPATGQSWHQFKLSNWISLAGISLVAALWLGAAKTRGFGRIVLGALALWCTAGLAANLALSERRVTPFAAAAGIPTDPLGAYRGLRDAIHEIPLTETIGIESGSAEAKTRQLLTYFLHDRKLSGHWSDDPGMLSVFLPATPAVAPQWVIRINPPAADPAIPAGKFGNLTLERADSSSR